MQTSRVIVVGAGLSGLVAARELVRAGIAVTVLESLDRVGGRLKPGVLPNGREIDAGGEFCGPGFTRLMALAHELDLEWVPLQLPEGGFIRTFGGARLIEEFPFSSDSEALEELGRAIGIIDDYASRLDVTHPASTDEMRALDALSVGQWLDANVAHAAVRSFIAAEANPTGGIYEVSMLSFVWLIARLGGWEGHDQIAVGHFKGGAAQLPIRLAAQIGDDKILKNTRVSTITQSDNGVLVSTDRGDFQADAVILATAGNTNGINFDPALPPGHQALADGWVPYHTAKVFLEYDHKFWVDEGLNGVALGEGYLYPMLDVSYEDEAVLCGMVFHPEVADPTVTDEEILRKALANAIELYGPRAARPNSAHMVNWGREASWSGGAGNSLRPGVLSRAGDAVQKPFGRIAWAGADRGANDYMEGAVDAGQRAASQINHMLTPNRID